MRLLGRLLLFGILAAVFGMGLWQLAPKIESGPAETHQIEDLQRAAAYVLPADTWLEIPLVPFGDALVRVISNASARAAALPEPETVLTYAIDYQFIAADGSILDDQRYHHRTRLTRYRETGNVDGVRARFLDRRLQPLDGRVMLLSYDDLPSAARLRLRLADHDPGVTDAVVRVYQRERLPEYKLATRWARLTHEQREAKVRGNVYLADRLAQPDAASLLRYRWNPAGPDGLLGQDYDRRMLYLDILEEAGQGAEATVPAGLLAEPGHDVSVSLPPLPAGIILEVESLTPPRDGHVVVRYTGDEALRDVETRLALSGPVARRTFDFRDGGVLRLSSDLPVTVRVYHADEPDLEVEAEPVFLVAYLADAERDLRFTSPAPRTVPVPFRIDTRALLEPEAASAEYTLGVSLETASGEVLGTVQCRHAAARSFIDRPRLAPDDPRVVAESRQCYVHLPPTATTLRLRPSRPVLVKTYTRPAAALKLTTVPYDYQRAPGGKHAPVPGWFALRPEDRKTLARDARRITLTLGEQADPADERLLAGRYRWEEFPPDGRWIGRHLFMPRDSKLPVRDRAAGVAFHELSGSGGELLEFVDPADPGYVAPRLVVLRAEPDPTEVTVYLDRAILLRRALRGRRIELTLPAFAAGSHRLRVDTRGGARVFVNQVRSGEADWLRRLAVHLSDKPLSFTFDKALPEELLTARLHLPIGSSAEPVHLRVRIEIPTAVRADAATAWTFADRRYVVHPDRSQRAPILGTADQATGLGRRLFIPLKADLPAGRYRLSMWLENAPEAYVSLYRLTPGDFELEAIHRSLADVR